MFHDPSGDPITAVLDALLDQREARPPQGEAPAIAPSRPPKPTLAARLLAAIGPRWGRRLSRDRPLP